MRILLISSSYPPVLGGLQTVTSTLVQQWRQQGHHVQVVTNRYPRQLPRHEIIDHITVHRHLWLRPQLSHLLNRRPDLFLAGLYFQPHSQHRLYQLMTSFQPDVINVHFPDAQIPFVLAIRRKFQCRLVISLHGNDIERWLGNNLQNESQSQLPQNDTRLTLLKQTLQAADAVTACSPVLLEKAIILETTIQDKGTAIQNGIDPLLFENQVPYHHPKPYLFAFGRLTHTKGFDLLIDAFKQIAIDNPALDLLIAGDGSEIETLKLKIQQLGLDNRVMLLGPMEANHIVQLLNGCQGVIVPSRQEGFGIAALEALAAGKPLLATRVGGMVEFLQTVNAHFEHTMNTEPIQLVHPSVPDLVAGLRQLLRQAKNYCGEKAMRAYIVQHYSWAKIAQQYETVLKRVL